MKKFILIPLLFGALFLVSPKIYASSDPANPPSRHGAPIGGGLFILLGLGAAYAGKKIYQYRSQGPED